MQVKDALGIKNQVLERKEQAGAVSGKAGKAKGGKSEADAVGQDTVSISGQSREIAKAHEAVSTESAQRAQKIADIKNRIENNSYEVDSGKVAHKMVMDFLKEMV